MTSSKLDAVIVEICLRNRTGNLSGLAKPSSTHNADMGNKAYSLLFHAGVLQMCQFAGNEGLVALNLLLKSSPADKFSWFAMNESGIPSDAPTLAKSALLALLNAPEALLPSTAAYAPNTGAPVLNTLQNPSQNNALGGGISPALQATAKTALSKFFGDRWEQKLTLARVSAGQNASDRQVVDQLVLLLAPIAGKEFAQDCFKQFL